MCQSHVLSEDVVLAGVTPYRTGTLVGAYKTADSLPAQKRVRKRKGPDGTSPDRVSQILGRHQSDLWCVAF